jgi:regulator of cell morphogenesis and NO signaling
MTTTNLSGKTVGDIVTDDYRTAEIFEKHGIDFCCGGNVTLADACLKQGIDPASLVREIEGLQQAPVDRSRNYSAWTLSFLADYIVNTHHAYLKENDDQIVAYTQKIASVHGARHPEVIKIAVIFEKIATDLVAHLKEEEEVFFPAIKRAEAARISGNQPDTKDRETIKNSLVRLHREHEEVGDAIHEIRRLANGFSLPDDVCNTFMLTYRKLDEFEEDLHKHVHLENNILFLKAATL